MDYATYHLLGEPETTIETKNTLRIEEKIPKLSWESKGPNP